MPCRHQLRIRPSRHLRARPVEAVEGAGRDIEVELGPVGGERGAIAVEHLDRRSARVRLLLDHHRRNGVDQHRLGDAARFCPGDIARDFAAAGRMADVDRVPEVERSSEVGDVGRVGVHLIAAVRLVGPAVAAAVVGDDAISFAEEEQHLVVPVVRAERPAVMEDDRLGVLRAPVLVENRAAVLGRDEAHQSAPVQSGCRPAGPAPVSIFR